MTTRRAACSCGQLSITCQGEPVRGSVCHCGACKRRTGSAFGVQARFPADRTATGGETAVWKRRGDSGGTGTLRFCPVCGSTVWWTLDAIPDFVMVAVGAFADPGFPEPSISVYGELRHPWVGLDASLTLE